MEEKGFRPSTGMGRCGGPRRRGGALHPGGAESHLAQREPEVLEEQSSEGAGQRDGLGPASGLDCDSVLQTGKKC